MLYLIGFFFLKKYFVQCNGKKILWGIFMLKVRTDCITNNATFESLATLYFGSKWISSNIRTDYFCTPLFEVKIYNT